MSVMLEHFTKASLDCIVEIVHKPLREKGEDSFAYSFEKDNLHTQAVFDGCGGSGSWQYAEFKNSTGAFIAAQSMAKAHLEWFKSLNPATVKDSVQVERSFHSMANQVLSNLKRNCAPMKISGSLVKSFPCTASVAITAPNGDYLSLTTLNVGDSRVYFLSPQTGLVQLTVDDTQGDPDPLESLWDSAPMSDMLNADNPFVIKCRQLSLTYPCAVITATDGVFGYFRSPMDFEFILLDAIMHSNSFAQFESSMKERIVKVTGDDSTCIISLYGWNSFENVKKKLAKRFDYVSTIVSQLEEATKQGMVDEALKDIWKEYRKQTLFDEMQG